jgi:hypothetical protein
LLHCGTPLDHAVIQQQSTHELRDQKSALTYCELQ